MPSFSLCPATFFLRYIYLNFSKSVLVCRIPREKMSPSLSSLCLMFALMLGAVSVRSVEEEVGAQRVVSEPDAASAAATLPNERLASVDSGLSAGDAAFETAGGAVDASMPLSSSSSDGMETVASVESVAALSADAKARESVSSDAAQGAAQGGALIAANSGAAGAVSGAAAADSAAASAGASHAVSSRAGCHPQCAWKCDAPTCDMVCDPVCEQPRCAYRCAHAVLPRCEIKCPKPKCEVRCPAEHCGDSNCPDCVAVCAKARCRSECDSPVVCSLEDPVRSGVPPSLQIRAPRRRYAYALTPSAPAPLRSRCVSPCAKSPCATGSASGRSAAPSRFVHLRAPKLRAAPCRRRRPRARASAVAP